MTASLRTRKCASGGHKASAQSPPGPWHEILCASDLRPDRGARSRGRGPEEEDEMCTADEFCNLAGVGDALVALVKAQGAR